MIAVRHERMRTPDGATLAVYDTGGGPGPALLLAGGLCGDVDAWRPLLEDFAPHHRIVSWDYRGLFGSRQCDPRDPRVERHASDLGLVLDHFGIDQAVAIGWSMGARVALHGAAQQGGRLAGVIAIGGTFGRPFQRLLEPVLGPLAATAPMWLKAAELAAPGWRDARWIVGRLARRGMALDVLKLLGAIGETADLRRFSELVADAARQDPVALTSTLYALGEYCAEAPLERLALPALVIHGDRDPFTSVQEAERAAWRLGADLMVVPSGTHFTLIEFPELLALRVEKFLLERLGFDRTAADT